MMRFSAAAALVFVISACRSTAGSVRAFGVAPKSTRPQHADGSVVVDRRRVFQNVLLGTGAASLLSPIAPASAGLLDDYGGTDMKITNKVAEKPVVAQGKVESNMEPNLRSNYYYPTNKKRYLPRIKRCNDAIPEAAAAIGTEDWEAASEFAFKIADDTVLPMKLYTSSLLGGGTNVKVAFAKDMTRAADDFERAQKKLVKAVTIRDRESSSTALEQLATALQVYREAGRLTGPDGGGDIPSVDEIRRSACRQGRTYEKTVKERDARLQELALASSQ